MEWLVIVLSAGCNPKMVLTTDRSVTGTAAGPSASRDHRICTRSAGTWLSADARMATEGGQERDDRSPAHLDGRPGRAAPSGGTGFFSPLHDRVRLTALGAAPVQGPDRGARLPPRLRSDPFFR